MSVLTFRDWEVLVVDDEADNLTLLETILMFYDIRVTTTGSGEAALELLKSCRFKLALLDLQMPKVTGWHIVKWARESDSAVIRQTYLIAVTAQAMTGDQERVLEAGFDGYIAKPVEAGSLVETIQRFINNRSLIPEPTLLPADTSLLNVIPQLDMHTATVPKEAAAVVTAEESNLTTANSRSDTDSTFKD